MRGVGLGLGVHLFAQWPCSGTSRLREWREAAGEMPSPAEPAAALVARPPAPCPPSPAPSVGLSSVRATRAEYSNCPNCSPVLGVDDMARAAVQEGHPVSKLARVWQRGTEEHHARGLMCFFGGAAGGRGTMRRVSTGEWRGTPTPRWGQPGRGASIDQRGLRRRGRGRACSARVAMLRPGPKRTGGMKMMVSSHTTPRSRSCM